jgi:hypothetical protein
MIVLKILQESKTKKKEIRTASVNVWPHQGCCSRRRQSGDEQTHVNDQFTNQFRAFLDGTIKLSS